MVKHTQTIRREKPTNCLSMFDNFVGLALKGLREKSPILMTLVEYMVSNCKLRHNSKCNLFLLRSLSMEAETAKHQLSNRDTFMWY